MTNSSPTAFKISCSVRAALRHELGPEAGFEEAFIPCPLPRGHRLGSMAILK